MCPDPLRHLVGEPVESCEEAERNERADEGGRLDETGIVERGWVHDELSILAWLVVHDHVLDGGELKSRDQDNDQPATGGVYGVVRDPTSRPAIAAPRIPIRRRRQEEGSADT